MCVHHTGRHEKKEDPSQPKPNKTTTTTRQPQTHPAPCNNPPGSRETIVCALPPHHHKLCSCPISQSSVIIIHTINNNKRWEPRVHVILSKETMRAQASKQTYTLAATHALVDCCATCTHTKTQEHATTTATKPCQRTTTTTTAALHNRLDYWCWRCRNAAASTAPAAAPSSQAVARRRASHPRSPLRTLRWSCLC